LHQELRDVLVAETSTSSTSKIGTTSWLLPILSVLYVVEYGMESLIPSVVDAPFARVPTGLSLAFCLLFGSRVWPAILVGAAVGRLAFNYGSVPIGLSLSLAVVDTLEPLLTAFLLLRVHGFDVRLRRVYDVLGLFFWGTTLTAGLGGLATTLLCHIWPTEPAIDHTLVCVLRWLWSGISMLLWTSLVLAWFAKRPSWPHGRKLLELIGLSIAIPIACEIAFGDRIPLMEDVAPFAFVVFPFVIYASFRCGVFGAAGTSGIVTLLAVGGLIHWRSIGPWSTSVYETLITYYSFALATSLTSLVTATALDENRLANRDKQRSSQDLATVLSSIPDLLLVVGKDGVVRHLFSASNDTRTNWASPFVGRHASSIVPPATAAMAMATIAEVIETGQPVSREYSLEMRGETAWFSARVVPFGSPDDPCVLWVSRDVTDLISAHRHTTAVERLLRKLLNLQEQERKLLSYEIHDGLVQFMVGAHMAIESIRDDPDLNTDEARHQLTWCQQLITKAIQEARHMISKLRPMIIDEQGLVQGVNYLIEEQNCLSREITFRHDLADERLPGLLEATVFRIVQEALANIAQHSQASRASIELRQTQDSLVVVVEDDGRGFDKRKIPQNRFGVEGIVKRVELLGGTVDIRTAPGSGTTISVQLPLKLPDDEPSDSPDDSAWRKN
jgi:signal transduction histidine kinase